jgi:hypothetical protein
LTADGGHVVQRLAEGVAPGGGEDPVALYITERKGGKLVVGHNLSLLPPRLERETQAAGLDGFWAGRHLQHALEGMEWDLNVYLPIS